MINNVITENNFKKCTNHVINYILEITISKQYWIKFGDIQCMRRHLF